MINHQEYYGSVKRILLCAMPLKIYHLSFPFEPYARLGHREYELYFEFTIIYYDNVKNGHVHVTSFRKYGILS